MMLPDIIPDVPGPGAPIAETARSIYEAITQAKAAGGVPMTVALLGVLATLFGLKIVASAFSGTRITPAMALQFVLAFGASTAYPLLLRGLWTPVWNTVYAPDSGIAGNITAWTDSLGILAEAANAGGDLRNELGDIVELKLRETVCGPNPPKAFQFACDRLPDFAGRVVDGFLTYVLPFIPGGAVPAAGLSIAGLAASTPAIVFRSIIVPIGRIVMTAGLYFFYIGIAAFVAFTIAVSPLLGPFLMLQTTQDLALRPLRWTLQATLMALALAAATGPIAQMTAAWTDQTLQNFCDTQTSFRRSYRSAQEAVRSQLCPRAAGLWECGQSVTLDLARARSWPGQEGKELQRIANRIIARHIRGCAITTALASDAPYRRLAENAGSDVEASLDAAIAAFAALPGGAVLATLWKAVISMLVSGLLFLSSPIVARALLPSSFWDNIDLMLKTKVLAAAGIPVAHAQTTMTGIARGVSGAGAALTTGIGTAGGAIAGGAIGAALGGPPGMALGAAAGGALGAGIGRVAAVPFSTARRMSDVAAVQPRETGERASVAMPRPD